MVVSSEVAANPKGGGMYCDQPSVAPNVEGTVFQGNIAGDLNGHDGLGGGWYSEQCSFSPGILFDSNTALGPTGSGGGMYAENSYLLFTNQSNFTNNAAKSCGGMSWSGNENFQPNFDGTANNMSVFGTDTLIDASLRYYANSYRNSAEYANGLGSVALYIRVIYAPNIIQSGVSPGVDAIKLEILDIYGNRVTSDNFTVFTISANGSSASLSGSYVFRAIQGWYDWTEMQLTGTPGLDGNLNIQADLQGRSLSCYPSAYATPLDRACVLSIKFYNCSIGTYVDRNLMCTNCSSGSFSTTINAKTCTSCPLGQHQPYSGQSACTSCFQGSFSASLGQTNCSVCGTGTYAYGTGKSACSVCGTGIECIDGTAVAKSGYWLLEQPESLSAYLCPTGICTNGSCAAARQPVSGNVLCGECLPTYTEWNGTCMSCPDYNVGLLIAYLVLGWGFVLFLHITGSPDPKRKPTGHVAIFLYFMATSRYLIGGNYQWMNWLGVFDIAPYTSTGSSSSSLVCPGPITAYGYFGVKLMTPLIDLGFVALTMLTDWAFKVVQSKRGQLPEAVSYAHYVRTVTTVITSSYTSISDAIFNFLNCVPVGPNSVVFSSPSIDCHTMKYKYWLILMYIILVFLGLGFPIFVANIVYKRKKGKETKEKAVMDIFNRYYGNLYEMFKDHALWWNIIILFRRVGLVGVGVAFWSYPLYRGQALLIFNFGVLMLHFVFQPFKTEDENELESLALAFLVLQSSVQVGIDSSDVPLGTSVLVSIFICLPAAWILVSSLYKTFYPVMARRARNSTSTVVPYFRERTESEEKRETEEVEARSKRRKEEDEREREERERAAAEGGEEGGEEEGEEEGEDGGTMKGRGQGMEMELKALPTSGATEVMREEEENGDSGPQKGKGEDENAMLDTAHSDDRGRGQSQSSLGDEEQLNGEQPAEKRRRRKKKKKVVRKKKKSQEEIGGSSREDIDEGEGEEDGKKRDKAEQGQRVDCSQVGDLVEKSCRVM